MPDDDTTPPDTQPDPEAFAPLPPDTPLLTVLGTLARHIKAKTGKPASFMAIPRKLALPLAGERAAAKQTVLEEDFMRACLDARLPAMLLAVPVEPDGPAIPVVAIDMPAPLAAAWNWPVPRFAHNEGFEEHPVYAACPFSRTMWDRGDGRDIPALCRRLLDWCKAHAETRPAPVFQPVWGQAAAARPLVGQSQDAERLPDDPALAWPAIEAGLEAHAEAIRKELATKGIYGMEFDGELPEDIVSNFKSAFVDKFSALAEYGPHPLRPGWFALVATPMTLEGTQLN